MAKTQSVLDKYAQFACLSVAGAGTPTGENVAQLVTGLTSLQKVLWAVSRIEYSIPQSWKVQMTVHQHYIMLGLSAVASTAQPVNLLQAGIYDFTRISQDRTPAALGEVQRSEPITKVFPEGQELLILPQNVFLVEAHALTGAGTAADVFCCRIWYKEIEVGPEDWYDLLQMRLPLGAV